MLTSGKLKCYESEDSGDNIIYILEPYIKAAEKIIYLTVVWFVVDVAQAFCLQRVHVCRMAKV